MLDDARVARAAGDIHAIEDDIALYQTMNNGQLPDDLSQVGDGWLRDPWHHAYQYLNHSTMKGNGQTRKDRFLVPLNDDYDLYSMGKDGGSVQSALNLRMGNGAFRCSITYWTLLNAPFKHIRCGTYFTVTSPVCVTSQRTYEGTPSVLLCAGCLRRMTVRIKCKRFVVQLGRLLTPTSHQ
jgi:hypothetical protein